MMSPYESERIFEAEMVRLHQCDRTLYVCAKEMQSQPRAESSIIGWLTSRVALLRMQESVPATSPAPQSNHR